MARAAPPITLVAVIVTLLALTAFAAPEAGARPPAAAAEAHAAKQARRGAERRDAGRPANRGGRSTRDASRGGRSKRDASRGGRSKRDARRPDRRARRPAHGGRREARGDRRARAPHGRARRPARRGGRPERRCSAAGIRALHGTSRVERRLRCLVNVRRASAKLPPLRYDRCLDLAAERHARDMIRRHYFAHTSRSGRDLAARVRAAGYVRRAGSWRLGENLAWGTGDGASARATVHGWMTSPPHRANILTAGFRDLGVAVVRGAPVSERASAGPATIVVEFGARHPGRCHR